MTAIREDVDGRRRGVAKPGMRVRYGQRLGVIVTWWLDGKWAVQLAGHPRGSYTLLDASQMRVIP